MRINREMVDEQLGNVPNSSKHFFICSNFNWDLIKVDSNG